MSLRLSGRSSRSFCEACGDVPASAYHLHLRTILSTGQRMTLCEPCWDDCLHQRPYGVKLHEVLEELLEHRYRSPQRHSDDRPSPAGQSNATHWRHRY